MSVVITRQSSKSTNSLSSVSNSLIERLSNKFKTITTTTSTSSTPMSTTSISTSSTNSSNTSSSQIISSSPYGVVIDDFMSTNYFEESNNNLPVVINSYRTIQETNIRDHKNKIKIQSLIKSNGMINCGVTGIVGKLDEDRFSLLNDQKSSLSSSSLSALQQSFSCGLFDGHGGYFGSEYLSQSYLLLVQEEYQYKLTLIQKMMNTLDKNIFNMMMLNANGGGDILDTFMCESILKVTKYISREIKMRSITGSTCVALFIRQLHDGSFRVYCSNTGDSRCVMIHYKHSTSSSSSSSSFANNTTSTTEMTSTTTTGKNKSGKSKLIMSTVSMTEDHKISNSREYIRVVSRQPVVWYPLPCQAASVDITTTNDILSRKICTKHTKTYPTLSRIQRALILIQLLDKMSTKTTSSSSLSSSSGRTTNVAADGSVSSADINNLKSPSLSSSSSTFLASNKSLHSKQPQNRSVSDRHRKDLALSYLNDSMSEFSFSSKVSDSNKNNRVSELLHLMSLGDKASIIDSDQTCVENGSSEHSSARAPLDGSDFSIHGPIPNGLDKSLSDLDLDSRHHGLDNISTAQPTLTSTLTTVLSSKAAPITSSLSSLSTPYASPRPIPTSTATTSKSNNTTTATLMSLTPTMTPRSNMGGKQLSISEIHMLYTDAAIPLSASFHIVNNAYNTNNTTITSNSNSKHSESVSNIRESLSRNNSISPRVMQVNQSSSSSPRMMLNEEEIDELSMHSEGFVGLNPIETSSSLSSSSSPSSSGQQQKVIETVVDDEVEGPFITAPIKHRQSFISQRALKNGQKAGPEALFSRHNVSTTMTRSVGDRHAARSCVCTPEITAVTIGSNEYARFILGSDGIFDVVDNDKAVKLIKHIIDPIEASKTLSKYARLIREADGLRMDDITCIVVDINPHLNPNLPNSSNSSNGNNSEWKNLIKTMF